MCAYHLQLVPLAPHIVQTNLLLHLSASARGSGRQAEVSKEPKTSTMGTIWCHMSPCSIGFQDHTFPKIRTVINGVCGLLLYFDKASTAFRSWAPCAKLDAKQLLELVPQQQRQNRLLLVI